MSRDVLWFEEGLRFLCTGCGKCCTGTSNSVFLSQPDLRRLAGHLNLPAGRFARQYTRVVKGRRVLIDRPGTRDCIFLVDKSCSVYEARPTQCRTFPWWLRNIDDEQSWREAAMTCEGIDHPDATLVPAQEILAQCRLDAQNDLDTMPGRVD